MSMESEIKKNNQESLATKELVIKFLLESIPGYTESALDEPAGADQTTLNEFLTNKTTGSEWTDPHGFKINVTDDQYLITLP